MKSPGSRPNGTPAMHQQAECRDAEAQKDEQPAHRKRSDQIDSGKEIG